MNAASPVMRLTREHIDFVTLNGRDESIESLIVNGLKRILKSGGDRAAGLLENVDWKILMCKRKHIADTLSRNWVSMPLHDPSLIVANAVVDLPTKDGSFASITVTNRESLEDGSVTIAIADLDFSEIIDKAFDRLYTTWTGQKLKDRNSNYNIKPRIDK